MTTENREAKKAMAYISPWPGMRVGEAYVPVQEFGDRYPPAEALEKGTLFVELYRPYDERRRYRN